jgi:endogenous inhibitor of DNA gyrase (YacG/DUF329 family)
MTRKANGCPLCGATPSAAHAPFCGQGCRDRDLLNWLGEAYRVPARHSDSEDDDPVANGLDSNG